MAWWDKLKAGKSEGALEAALDNQPVALLRPRRAIAGAQAPVEATALHAIAESSQVALAGEGEQTRSVANGDVVRLAPRSLVGRDSQDTRSIPRGPRAVPPSQPQRGHSSSDQVETVESLKEMVPDWKGDCFEGVVAADMGRTLAVLWLGLGDVALLGTPEALVSSHAATVRDRIQGEFRLDLVAEINARPQVVGKVLENSAATISRARAGKPSRETYQLVLYDELIAAAVRGRASDVHFSIRKGQEDTALVALRMYGRYRPWRPKMAAHVVRGLLGSAFGQRLIAKTNSRSEIHWDAEIAFMTENTVDSVKWVGRCNGRADVQGYKLVTRLLESDPELASIPTLDGLGYVSSHIDILRMALRRNYGVFVIFGSTGSGKSTTLRTFMVRETDPTSLAAYSVESPVEYLMPGVTQFSIPVDVNMTSAEMSQKFLAVLRDVVRMDPDVLMVGEIRDHETAVLMSEFTRSGHRCFTSAHGDGVVDGLSRLCGEQIQLPSELLGGARFISASIYQRLLPTLCPHCKQPATGESGLPESKLQVLRQKYELDPGTMFVAKAGGCVECKPEVPGLRAEGTKGVTVAAEVMVPNARMRELAAKRDWIGVDRTWRQTRRAGFGEGDMTGKTAFECALYLASQGKVSIADIEAEFEPVESYEVMDLVPVAVRGGGR